MTALLALSRVIDEISRRVGIIATWLVLLAAAGVASISNFGFHAVGSRLLRAWLLRPLVSIEPIRDRLVREALEFS
jgi:TRAP-type mannitol/chloroaromatic compound transport system permease small subunit